MTHEPWLDPRVLAGFAAGRTYRRDAAIRQHAAGTDASAAERTHLTNLVGRLARRARARHPGYAALYAGLPEDLAAADLPVLSRTFVAEHEDAFLAAAGVKQRSAERFLDRPFALGSRYDDDLLMFTSSGSSGRRKIIPARLEEFARSTEAFHTRVLRPVGARRLLYVGLADRHNGGNAWMFYLRGLLDVRIVDAFTDPARLTEIVLQYQPDVILTRPRLLGAVAKQAAARGRQLPKARLISVGEHLSAAQADSITAAWGSAPHNSYSTVETGPIGFQSAPERAVLDVYTDLSLVEVLAADGRPITEPGVPGRLVVSTVYADRLPYLRYEVGDAVAWADAELTRLTFPFGRLDEGLEVAAGGTRVLVPEKELAVLSLPGIRQFQIVQRAPSWLEVRYEAAEQEWPRLDQLIVASLRELLARYGADALEVSALPTSLLAPDRATGKLKRVVRAVDGQP
ncbi:AMP-binding protein [Frankia sp. CiP3]|uniref:AMP-binding protein n=1 Tax=Frankia sp. CiP3 TaxID=2880971 RepID=UPI001EF4930E|nr:AMP-binding protein [Frankia sp. CiP3]